MTKSDLSTLLHKLNIPVGEGEHFIDSKDKMPKVSYWEMLWTDYMASGDDYEELVTYQVSLVSSRPRDPKLLQLKKLLNTAGLHPDIYHEYINPANAPGYYHSYFSIEVTEGLGDG